jgi:hypothetical protein
MGRIAALAIALSLAGAARAADETTYLYGAVGTVRTDPGVDQAAADAALLGAGATEFASKLDRWDSGWKIMVGWMPNRHFALEGGFTALGTATYMAQFTNGQAKSEFRSGGILFDALGLAPVSDSFSFFGKVGVIAANVVTSQTVTLPGGTEHLQRERAHVQAELRRRRDLRLRQERLGAHRGRALPAPGNETTGVSNVDMISIGFVLRL